MAYGKILKGGAPSKLFFCFLQYDYVLKRIFAPRIKHRYENENPQKEYD